MRQTSVAATAITATLLTTASALAGGPSAVEPGWTLIRTIEFLKPVAPHFSPVDGRIHVARSDTATDGVYRLSPTGFATLLAAADRPSGVVIDPIDGDIFVSEAFDGRIFRTAFGTTGRELWVAGFHSGDDDPVGMAIAPADYAGDVVAPGEALVADWGFNGADEIWRWSPATPEGETAVHTDDGTLVDCYDVAFRGDEVYVTDDPGRILRLEADGTLVPLTLGAPIGRPFGLTTDPLTGDLLVLDADLGRIVRLDPETGSVSDVVIGLNLQGPDLIRNFAAIDVSPDGSEIVVSEREQDRIHIFRRCDIVFSDCDGDGIDDGCEIASGAELDCNGNGVPDDCDIVSGTSEDCDADGIPDDCPQCPIVEVVFVWDTSSSMNDEAAALCASIASVLGELGASGVDVIPTIWGISATPGGAYGCLTSNVIVELGTTVPGSPPAGLEFLGDCPGGNEVPSEDWALATAIVAGNYPWAADTLRLVIPLSDEGPWCGDPVTDLDEAAIDHAISVAASADVIVSPVIGSGANGATIDLAQLLADGTGGLRFLSSEGAGDIAAGVRDLVLAACTSVEDCNGNGTLDSCDIASGASLDADGDGIPDECQCPADLDRNGEVEFDDLLIVLASWDGPEGDIDGDGVTSFSDLLIVLAAWGPCA